MWTTDSLALGRALSRLLTLHPAMLNFFVSACHIGNLIWFLLTLTQTLTLIWSCSGIYPVITPGLWICCLEKTAYESSLKYSCLMCYLPMMLPLRIEASPFTLSYLKEHWIAHFFFFDCTGLLVHHVGSFIATCEFLVVPCEIQLPD